MFNEKKTMEWEKRGKRCKMKCIYFILIFFIHLFSCVFPQQHLHMCTYNSSKMENFPFSMQFRVLFFIIFLLKKVDEGKVR